jgi:hypothetical protein
LGRGALNSQRPRRGIDGRSTIFCGVLQIPAVAARGLVVIARGRTLRTKPVEVRAPWQHGLRVF